MMLVVIAALVPACIEERLGPDRADRAAEAVAALASIEAAEVIGNTMPGSWRPFEDSSPWNTPIPADAPTHPDSDSIIAYANARAQNLSYSRSYTIPMWVVDARQIAPVTVRSDRIFDWWDVDRDGWSDVGVPITRSMWQEQTQDGHICIVDPTSGIAWEMSRFDWPEGGPPQCTTFNLWSLHESGYGNPNEGDRWGTRGGRGSGFPLIAGLLRPEEVEAGEIRHALTFTFSGVRMGSNGEAMFIWPPACRGDGNVTGEQYPVEGMRFQLDPDATDADFDSWGLSAEARIVARALQTYGMFLGDRGGDMKIQLQLLAKDSDEHRRLWDERFPGFYRAIEGIPTNRLRVVYTGEPTLKPH